MENIDLGARGGAREDGRVPTVKPWLVVIVPGSSSSGHVGYSAFVNIYPDGAQGAHAQKPPEPQSICWTL